MELCRFCSGDCMRHITYEARCIKNQPGLRKRECNMILFGMGLEVIKKLTLVICLWYGLQRVLVCLGSFIGIRGPFKKDDYLVPVPLRLLYLTTIDSCGHRMKFSQRIIELR